MDGALIKGDEVEAQRYGPSTAKAVLAYKRKRKIINPTYQKAADNIVGKMTIAAMDKEMATSEKSPPLRGCTTDFGGGCATSKLKDKVGVGETRQLEFPPARLNLAFQEAFKPKESIPGDSIRTVLLVSRATKLLAPFNLKLSTIFLPSFDYAFACWPKGRHRLHLNS